MAKKETARATEPPAPDKGEPPGRLKGSWREAAVKELGAEASDQAIADRMNAYASEAGYGWKATAEWVGSKRGDGKPRQSRTRASADDGKTEPTLSDLLKVREKIGGDFGTFKEEIRRVDDLAREVGGLDMLRRCVDALEKLAGG